MTTLKKWLADERKALRKRARYLKIVERLQKRFPDMTITQHHESFKSSFATLYANDFRTSYSPEEGHIIYTYVFYSFRRYDRGLRRSVPLLTISPLAKVYRQGTWDGGHLQESPTWQDEMRQDKVPTRLINQIRRRLLQEYSK